MRRKRDRKIAMQKRDERLVNAFIDGQDIHQTAAAAALQKAPEDVTGSERQSANALNFGLMYGAGVDTFRQSALKYGVTLTEA
ncbi:MAG: DNA polymerase [Halobacteriota archaeon]